MNIRPAGKNDIDGLLILLHEVLEVHAKEYPKIFISGTTKYSGEELLHLIEKDDKTLILVAEEDGKIIGHAFLKLLDSPETRNTYPARILYIDDICVDEEYRGRHVAKSLFEHVLKYAKNEGFDRIELNVWEKNETARAFYESLSMRPLKTTMYMELDNMELDNTELD